MRRALWLSWVGGCFLMSEVPLCSRNTVPCGMEQPPIRAVVQYSFCSTDLQGPLLLLLLSITPSVHYSFSLCPLLLLAVVHYSSITPSAPLQGLLVNKDTHRPMVLR